MTKADEAFAVGSDGVWVQIPNMLNSHCLGGTILLDTSEVLVTTGSDGSGLTPTSELYDPLSQTWTSTGNVNQARHSWRKPIVKLNDEIAMLVGGADANVTSLASTELYDPFSGTWSYTGSLNVPRRQPAVIKLQTGKVLAAAGANGAPDGNRFLNSSEIYDPATEQWTYSGNLNVAREVGNFVMLHGGRVMVAGGEGPWFVPGNTAEIYDPNTGNWTLTAPMLYGWFGGASMTVLNDGRVLVAGGWDGNVEHVTAMIYDPDDNTWTYTGSMNYPHGDNSALLSDGKVLVMGGGVNGKSAEVYDPNTGQWTLIEDMHQEFNTPHGIVTLPNGDVFVAGACTGTAEILTTPTDTATMQVPTSGYIGFLFHQRVDSPYDCLDVKNDKRSHQGIDIWTNQEGKGTTPPSPKGHAVRAAYGGTLIAILDGDNKRAVDTDGEPTSKASILVIDHGHIDGQPIYNTQCAYG